LTAGAFVTRDTREAIGRIEFALDQVIAAEVVEKKLKAAQRAGRIGSGGDEALLREALAHGVIDESEAGRYRNAQAARREVITVDEFPQGYLGTGGS
jgi:acyl-CoA dehydrogenase